MNTYEIFACSAFGLADKVAQVEGSEYTEGFYLADAVLPAHPFGEIRTGEIAESERIHSGLSWPPEARVGKGEPLRRAPIPCVWRGLVEAGDRTIQWQIGRGVSFTLSRILGRHVSALLANAGCKSQDKIILAIPDNLDEFGQDALLRDLKFFGYPHVELLWRPVAAAISWVSELDSEGAFSLEQDSHEHVIVAYLGPDGVEITPFALKRVVTKNGTWVIPVRERPAELISMTGFDWAANALEAFNPNMDDGAFWQAFTKFPHVWEAMALRPFQGGKEIWSFKDRWTTWEPDAHLNENVREASSGPNKRLRAILGRSCHLFEEKQIKTHKNISEKLYDLFRKVAGSRSGSRLRGVVLTGSLCPSQVPKWMSSTRILPDSMSKHFSDCYKPKIDSIWLAHKTDALLDGCMEYGRRIDLNLPTYRDTLPKISMLVQKKGQHIWVPLLNAETCEGGQDYKPEPIRGEFAIQTNAKSLLVYLKKGDVQGKGNIDEECEKEQLSKNSQKLYEIAIQAGCYEKVLENDTKLTEKEEKYLHNIARKLFGNPFRRAEFPFPVVPTKDMPVDISVKIRPASGLAKISLTPSNVNDVPFLRGRQICLDYSTMGESDPPPPPKRGWPDVVSIKVDPFAHISDNQRYDFENFLQSDPNEPNYKYIVKKLGCSLQIKTHVPAENGFISFCLVNEYGMAKTESINKAIDRIAAKASIDYNSISFVHQRYFTTRISWVYAKTPINIRNSIYKNISSHYKGDWVLWIDAAGRVFTEKNELQHLYKKIVDRIRSQHQNPFPIQSSRALWRTLTLREESPYALTAEYSKAFVKETVKIMKRESVRRNYAKSFFQAARLFLYLLRFRIVKPDFLDPDNILDGDLFEDAVKCLQSAEEYFAYKQNAAAERAREIVIGIKDFMHYEGSNDILTALDKQIGDN